MAICTNPWCAIPRASRPDPAACAGGEISLPAVVDRQRRSTALLQVEGAAHTTRSCRAIPLASCAQRTRQEQHSEGTRTSFTGSRPLAPGRSGIRGREDTCRSRA